MKIIKIAALLAGVFSVAGCTAPTGIVPIGSGLYLSSKLGGMGVYSGGQVKAELFKDAAAFCAKLGKEVSAQNSSSIDSLGLNYASAEIQFKCV